MARPLKKGVDYFPMDVIDDDKIELLEATHGLEGYAVLIKIWKKIYINGYYIEWNKDNEMLFARRSNVGVNLINSVVNECLLRSLFDKRLHDTYNILTSKGVQERYFKICKDAKRKNVSAVKEYLLVDLAHIGLTLSLTSLSTEKTIVKSEFTPEETPLIPEESTQRKEDKRKEDNNNITVVYKSEENQVKNLFTEDCKTVVDYLNRKTGKSFKPATANTKKLIRARLNDGFELEDFKKVIDIKVKEWKGGDMDKFLRPETLFSNKFEGYLNQVENSRINTDRYKDVKL